MRPPVTSEASAFRAVLVIAGLTIASTGIGYLLGSATVGGAVLCVGVIVALAFASASGRTALPVEEAEREGEDRQRRPRILLVANVVPSEQQLADLRTSAPGAVLDVHTPVLQSRTHFATTDIDHEVTAARRRLDATLTAARRVGLDAGGEIGDAIDPLAGVVDRLRRHHIDRVVFASHTRDTANWVETDLLTRLRGQLHKPVSTIDGP